MPLESLQVRVCELRAGDMLLPALRIVERIEELSKRSRRIVFRDGASDSMSPRERVRVYRESLD